MLDLVALVVLGFGFYAGYSRGVIKTLFSIVSIVLGILIAMKISPYIISFLKSAFQMNDQVALIAGFVITLVLVIAIISFFGNMVEKMLKTINLNTLNKLLGGILFAFIFLLLLGMAEKFLTELGVITAEHIEKSISYPLVTALPNQAADVFQDMKPAFEKFWEHTRDAIEGIPEHQSQEK